MNIQDSAVVLAEGFRLSQVKLILLVSISICSLPRKSLRNSIEKFESSRNLSNFL